MLTNYLTNHLTEPHLTLPEGLLNLDPIYPVLRSGVDSVPCGGKLYGRLLQLYTSHNHTSGLKLSILQYYLMMLLILSAQLEGVRTMMNPQQMMMMPACVMLLKVTPFCIASYPKLKGKLYYA